MAVHNYESVYGSLPPAYVADRDGRPMHSWRVLLLPFLERGDIYAEYRFDQPWDGPDNRRLLDRAGPIFRRPEDPAGSPLTRFVAVVGDETAFPGARAIRFDEITDGTARTILFVEVEGSDIPWMEPRDLAFDRMPMAVNPRRTPGLRVGSPYPDVRAATVDGSVHRIKTSTTPQALRALLTARGGEAVSEGDW